METTTQPTRKIPPHVWVGLHKTPESQLAVNDKPKALDIVLFYCEHEKIPLEKLRSKSRDRQIVYPRHKIIHFLESMGGKIEYPYSTLGSYYCLRSLGALFNRDHCTVINCRKSCNNLLATDKVFFYEYHKTFELIKTKFKIN